MTKPEPAPAPCVVWFSALLVLFVPCRSEARQAIDTAALILETQLTERWLNGRQSPRFTPFIEDTSWVRVDSLRGPASGNRILYASLRGPYSGQSARVTLDGFGTVRGLEAAAMPIRPSPFQDSATFEMRRWLLGGRLALPGEDVWDVAPAFRPRRLARGERWTDTLRLDVRREGHRQALRGVRVSTLLRDTVVGGRTLWLVRDSAAVRYEERQLEVERTLGAAVTEDRVVEGPITGRRLHDPESIFPAWRDDTVRLAGDVTLRYPDGRTFRTSTRFESIRRQERYDTAAHAALQRNRRQEARDRRGGLIRYMEPGGIEARLRDGDVTLRDSLIAIWRGTRDPAEWHQLRGLIQNSSLDARDLARDIALEEGDTASALQEFVGGFFLTRQPIDIALLRFLQPFMSDPGIALALGVPRDIAYESLRDVLVRRPPALDEVTPARACTPDACRMLASPADTAVEPRLRDLGLLARFALEPRAWADEVTRRTRAGSVILQPAADLIQGVGSTLMTTSRRPMPPADANWRDWLEWADGRNPAIPVPRTLPAVQANRPRVQDSHRLAIRVYEALTGRPVRTELRAAYERATEDSARLVFGGILRGIGELSPSGPDDLARLFLTGSDAERSLARRDLQLVLRSAVRADSATTVELLDQLLALVIEDARPWPTLGTIETRLPVTPSAPSDSTPVFVGTDGLPAVILDRWASRARFVTPAESRAQDPRAARRTIGLNRVMTVGPFAIVGWSTLGWSARSANQTPVGYAAGTTFFLLRTERGWVIVDITGFIT